jgi:hypothetical protein
MNIQTENLNDSAVLDEVTTFISQHSTIHDKTLFDIQVKTGVIKILTQREDGAIKALKVNHTIINPFSKDLQGQVIILELPTQA